MSRKTREDDNDIINPYSRKTKEGYNRGLDRFWAGIITLCAVIAVVWGIFTGNWKPLQIPACAVALLLAPSYIALFSNWPQAILTPLALLFARHFLGKYFSHDIFTQVILHCMEIVALYGIFVAGIALFIAWKMKASDVTTTSCYKNYIVPEARDTAKAGWRKFFGLFSGEKDEK